MNLGGVTYPGTFAGTIADVKGLPPDFDTKPFLETGVADAQCVGGMLLVNLPQAFAQSQLKLVVLDNGVTDVAATWMVSLYATGVIVGRFISGFA